MKITEELVDYVSELSRLKLPEAEKAAMAAELEKIVDYMDVLSGLDTTGGDALLAGAPASDGEAFLVPRAVE